MAPACWPAKWKSIINNSFVNVSLNGFPMNVSVPCTRFNNNRTSRCKCAIVFVPLRSGRDCTYKSLGDRQNGGEPEQYYWSVVVLSRASNDSMKKKQMCQRRLSRFVLSYWMLFLLPQLWIAKTCVVCTSKEYLCVYSLGWALRPPLQVVVRSGVGPLQEQSVFLRVCVVVGSFVYVSEVSSADSRMCVS